MVKATWNKLLVAQSDQTIVIEGNHYFPPQSVEKQYLAESDYRTTCPWKGEAHYYSLNADGQVSENAVWSYPQPKEKARQIAGYYAFGKDVSVQD